MVALAGLAPGKIGQAGRWLATAGTAAVLGAGWHVGHTGGMLVYRDGAASAFTSAGSAVPAGGGEGREGSAEEKEHRRGEDGQR